MQRATATFGAAALIFATFTTAAPPAAVARPNYEPYGHTSSTDHTLKPGCSTYRFSYVVDAPTEEWSAEFTLVNPNGRNLQSFFADAGSDPKRATIRWPAAICRSSTTYGRHKIKMRVIWQEGRDNFTAVVKPSFFRFTRP